MTNWGSPFQDARVRGQASRVSFLETLKMLSTEHSATKALRREHQGFGRRRAWPRRGQEVLLR